MDMEATVMGIGNHWGHGQLFERLLLYDAQAPRFSAEAWWHKAAIIRCMRSLQAPGMRETMNESERQQVDDALDPPTGAAARA
eukprot:g13512.t1